MLNLLRGYGIISYICFVFVKGCVFVRIVIKLGTSTLAYHTGLINLRRMEKLCRVISDLKNAGHEIVMVSSGAIGVGVGNLSLKERPTDIPTKQAAAAVGQCGLMYVYDKLFAENNHIVAQVLVTSEDLEDELRSKNFHNTLLRLIELNVIPIINENDTVATAEIAIGDNDTLSAMVAKSLGADMLILLSDINGLYTADPHTDPKAELIPVVEKITPETEALACGVGSHLGTGGMHTKIRAAKIATCAGCEMIIANGSDPVLLYDIIEGRSVGTKFSAQKE